MRPVWIIIGTLALAAAVLVGMEAKPMGRCKDVRYSCINNLRQIDGAKEQWVFERNAKNLPVGEVVDDGEVVQYIKGAARPKCPQGGVYVFGRVGEKPRCSIARHTLAD